MPISPTAEAFRAGFRRPSLTFAEITWRWVVGATATLLFLFGLIEYLDTLRVTSGDTLFLRTRNPFLVSQAIAHILHGSVSRAVLSLLVATMLLALLWMVAASLGRIATIEAMVEYFRSRFAAETEQIGEKDSELVTPRSGRFASLLRLNFLRVAVIVAAVVGFAGALVLASFASTPAHPRPGLAFLVFLPVVSVVCIVGYELNWLLSLAAVFVVRDGDDAVESIESAVELCRERTSAVFAVSTWTGLAHFIAFAGASTVVAFPIGLTGLLPWRMVVLLVILLTLAYLVVADWLYTVRLAGYVCIAAMPDALLAPPPTLPPPPVPAETIDRDELILSDIPELIPDAQP